MMTEFEMANLGFMHYFIGIEVKKLSDGIFISQQKYSTNLLPKWKMENCKPMSILINTNEKFFVEDGEIKVDAKSYRILVGSIMYLNATKPYIMQDISLISIFVQSSSNFSFG
jgi:hypothetical protein